LTTPEPDSGSVTALPNLREHKIRELEKSIDEMRTLIEGLRSEAHEQRAAAYCAADARNAAKILDDMAVAGRLRAFLVVTYERAPNGRSIPMLRWMTTNAKAWGDEKFLFDIDYFFKNQNGQNPPPGPANPLAG
jgi:hypothetical protein